MADYNTPFAVILRDALPTARDLIGRGEVITFETRGQSSWAPTVVSVKMVDGQEEDDAMGVKQHQRVEVGVVPKVGTALDDARRWVWAQWRGLRWRVIQPPIKSGDALVVYQLELMGGTESTAKTYRNT